MKRLEVLFTPAEFGRLGTREVEETTCVVFDILRATSSIVTALAHGAAAVIPVMDIQTALDYRKKLPHALLAGERDGVRILASISGGTDFDLGNSPREFTSRAVKNRTIITTTTNGTRAMRACAPARATLICSFLNLRATASFLRQSRPGNLLLVCSGTREEAAYEDILAAGGLCDQLWDLYASTAADSAQVARVTYAAEGADIAGAFRKSTNGKRLAQIPDLHQDLEWCARRDIFDLAVKMDESGRIVAV